MRNLQTLDLHSVLGSQLLSEIETYATLGAMPSLSEIPVQAYLDIPDGERFPGSAKLFQYSDPERTTRALKTLGALWLAAVLCVLIPLLHFVLVPLGLLAGPLVAWWVYGVSSEIQSGSVPCPKCKAAVPIEKQKPRWPLSEKCTSCQCSFRIERKS